MVSNWAIRWCTKKFCEKYEKPRCLEKAKKKSKICTMDYTPVCWKINVQCIKAPCDPVWETFSNKCTAENRWALDIYEWKCK